MTAPAATDRPDLTGQLALVTGGASGIGEATARRLHALGASIVIADVDESAGDAVAGGLGGLYLSLDVADPASWRAAADRLRSAGQQLDIANLNAGIMTGWEDLLAVPRDRLAAVIDINVLGVVDGIRALTPLLRAGGRFVVTASLAGLVPLETDPVYAMSKHAVVGLVRSVAPQLSARGISIHAIAPGYTDTPLLDPTSRELAAEAGLPLNDPADVAEVVIDALNTPGAGEILIRQPGRPTLPYQFRGVPGPLRQEPTP